MRPKQYIDYLTDQVGSRKKAREIIQTSKDPFFGITALIKKRREKNRMKQPIFFNNQGIKGK